MQDGARIHTTPNCLKVIKRNKAKSFPFSWPARSHDLTPCDFFLWGVMDRFIEEMEPAPKNDIELRQAILKAASAIDRDQLKASCDSVYSRCKLCIEADGGRFEYMK